MALAKAALFKSGQMDTRQLALAIMAAKGLDTGDKVLAKAAGVAARDARCYLSFGRADFILRETLWEHRSWFRERIGKSVV